MKPINERLKELEKLGYIFFNFEQGKKITRGNYKGWVDFVLVGHGTVYFFERKRKYEKLSEKQKQLARKLQECTFESVSGARNIVYDVVTDDNIDTIMDLIINQGAGK